MRYGKSVLLAIMLSLVFINTGSTAELRILNIGPGMGKVIGEGFSCSADCTKHYEKGTIVHLKAEAYSGSSFVEWRVNGKSHEGVIVMEDENMLVQAVFEQRIPDEPDTLLWYNGNTVERATLAADEVALYLDEEALFQMPLASEDEFHALLDELARQFDPQAEVFEYNTKGILLWFPVPLSREALGERIANFQPSGLVLKAGIVAYADPDIPGSRMLFDGRIVVAYRPEYTDEQIRALEEEYDLIRLEEKTIRKTFIYRVGNNPFKTIEIVNRIYESGVAEYAKPGWGRMVGLYSCPNEGMFREQWHLSTADYDEIDLKVLPVWDAGNHGAGNQEDSVVVAIVDSGVDYTHHDLYLNYREDLSWNYDTGKKNPFPRKPGWFKPKTFSLKAAAHGTNVAGLAVGTGNFLQEGVCGVAPKTDFAAIRAPMDPLDGIIHDRLADALIHQHPSIDIYNCSWGISPNPLLLSLNKSPDIERVLKIGIGVNAENVDVQGRGGRDGKGNIYVMAAGNDTWFLSNDALLNSRFTISVTATDHYGNHPIYPNQGAHILITAPSEDAGGQHGLTTTDYHRKNYTSDFGGTSGAAPLVSGVIALMLTANPELTWRDVQHILINTARSEVLKADTFGAKLWHTNGVYPYSYYYGFGLIDAAAAVEAASSWNLVPPEVATDVYEEDENGIIDVSKNIQIEWTEATFTSEIGPWWGINVLLKSPNGTESLLAKGKALAEGLSADDKNTFRDWIFGTPRHFGEASQGTWELIATDSKGNPVEFDAKLRFYGTELPPERCYVKQVKIEAGEETIYHAGWEPIEEQDLIVFGYYDDPLEPESGTEVQIEIRTSEPLQGEQAEEEKPSVRFAGGDDVPLNPCEDPQDGTCWQGSVTLPEEEDVRLTVNGRDLAGNHLLPFDDWEPKTLSEWTDADSEDGDRVHLLGSLLSAGWSVSAQEAVSCEPLEGRDGSVTCSFAGGTITLQAAEDGSQNLEFSTNPAAVGKTQSGAYWLAPHEGDNQQRIAVSVALHPQRSWFDDLPEFESQEVSVPCEEGPSAAGELQGSAEWSIESDEYNCRISLLVNGHTVVTSTLEPLAGGSCQLSIPDGPLSGEIEATLTPTWVEVDELREEEGYWDPIKIESGSGEVTEGYAGGGCRVETYLEEIFCIANFPGYQNFLYYYGCRSKEPWPPEAPDVIGFCPPPESVNEKTLHDLTTPPPNRVCETASLRGFVEYDPGDPATRDLFYQCDPRKPGDKHYSSDCNLLGGGRYIIDLIGETVYSWKKVVTECRSTYRTVEELGVRIDAGELPESLGIFELMNEESQPN